LPFCAGGSYICSQKRRITAKREILLFWEPGTIFTKFAGTAAFREKRKSFELGSRRDEEQSASGEQITSQEDEEEGGKLVE